MWCAATQARPGSSKAHGKFGVGVAGTGWIAAHIAAYELYVGDIPLGWEVDHLCNQPLCVRPSHLEAVPPAVNAERAAAEKRLSMQDGSFRQIHWIMDFDKADAIRLLYKGKRHGVFSQKRLAELYGVGRITVSNIVNRKQWVR